MKNVIRDIVDNIITEQKIRRIIVNWPSSFADAARIKMKVRSQMWRRSVIKCNSIILYPLCQISSLASGFEDQGIELEENSPLHIIVKGEYDKFLFSSKGSKIFGAVFAEGYREPVEIKMNSSDVVELTTLFDNSIPSIDNMVLAAILDTRKKTIIKQIENASNTLQ